MKCKSCGNHLDFLNVRYLEETEYPLFIGTDGKVRFGSVEIISGTERKAEIICPHCGYTLLSQEYPDYKTIQKFVDNYESI